MTRVLLLGAMQEEIAAYRQQAPHGKWNGADVAIARTGVGKICAAATTQRFIDTYQPHAILFTGLAGALDGRLKVGDIGLGIAAIDAEMDVRRWNPGYARGQIPFVEDGLPSRVFESDTQLVLDALRTGKPVFSGYIATGSTFLDRPGKIAFNKRSRELEVILHRFYTGEQVAPRRPNLYDMESSAVLQVANYAGIPALVIRTVSDSLRGDAAKELDRMLAQHTNNMVEIVEQVIKKIS